MTLAPNQLTHQGVTVSTEVDYVSPSIGTKFWCLAYQGERLEISADTKEQAIEKYKVALGPHYPVEAEIYDVSDMYAPDRTKLYGRQFYGETLNYGISSAQFALQGARWFECNGFTCIAQDLEHATMKFNGLLPMCGPGPIVELANLDFENALGLFFYIIRRA